jgi:hypothetical protein
MKRGWQSPSIGCAALLLVSCLGPPPPPPTHAQIDVSNHPWPQEEVSITADPTNAQVLLAASNSFLEHSIRVYGSTNGGRSWSSDLLPLPPAAQSSAADPWVAIDAEGRQYLSLLAYVNGSHPSNGDISGANLYVFTRSGPAYAWRTPNLPVVALVDPTRDWDDKPELVADSSDASPHRGRLYLAWTRLRGGVSRIVVAHSDDQAATWTNPVTVSQQSHGLGASVGISRGGDVYLAWLELGTLLVSRSTDGGDHWGSNSEFDEVHITAPLARCGTSIPAQPTACVHAFPAVAVDRSGGSFAGRTYAVYLNGGGGATVGVFVRAFNRDLTQVSATPWRVDPPDAQSPADRFHPAAAVDQGSGNLWVCFYNTEPDSRRVKTYFSCTISRDGGQHWARPVHAAGAPSDETQDGAFRGYIGSEYGDYEGLVVASGVAHPIWTDSRDLHPNNEEIYTTTLTARDLGPP